MSEQTVENPIRVAWREHYLKPGECTPPDIGFRPLVIDSNVCGACGKAVTPQ